MYIGLFKSIDMKKILKIVSVPTLNGVLPGPKSNCNNWALSRFCLVDGGRSAELGDLKDFAEDDLLDSFCIDADLLLLVIEDEGDDAAGCLVGELETVSSFAKEKQL